jgi:hypothetical protein
MRDIGVHGLLLYCSDYKCSHHVAISGDHWPDDVRLSDPRATSRQIKLAHGSVTRLDFVTRITAAIRLFA